MILLVIFFGLHGWGKGMLACSMNKDAAASMGINVKGMIFLSFILSATIGDSEERWLPLSPWLPMIWVES
jgi:branched-chain amino acid transport system permease protein